MRLDDLKSQIEHLQWENNHLKSTVNNLTQVNEALKSDVNQRVYVQEMTTQIANEETARKEELKLRVKSLEQTEALLRQALQEQQEERQKIATELMNRFAGSLPIFENDKDALAVVEHLCRCLDEISDNEPDWYGDMLERFTDSTNRMAAKQYRVTSLLRIKIHNWEKQRDQTFIFPSRAELNHYLLSPAAHKFTTSSPAQPFYAKPNEQYFVYANSQKGEFMEFVASDIHQALDVISAKGWKLKWMEAVG